MAFTGTLTDDQIEHAQRVRDHWMRVGLSTDRCDRPRAEAAVRAAYRAADIPEPQLVVWMDSPLGGVFAAAMIRELPKLGGQLGDQLGGQLRDQLRRLLGDQLWDRLDAQCDAYWICLHFCAAQVSGIDSARVDALADSITEVGGWWWPHERVAILTERPTAIHRDPQGRLHADGGPALTWADGYAQHWWHGTAVPEDFWTWDLSRVLAERNAEARRCGIERHGWDAVTDRLTLVDEADDPGNPGQRLELYDLGADLADLYPEPARILLCTNGTVERDGTRRRFGLPVPAAHTDPVAAAADLYGWPVEAYRRLEVRT